jgi:hypothetical protein
MNKVNALALLPENWMIHEIVQMTINQLESFDSPKYGSLKNRSEAVAVPRIITEGTIRLFLDEYPELSVVMNSRDSQVEYLQKFKKNLAV